MFACAKQVVLLPSHLLPWLHACYWQLEAQREELRIKRTQNKKGGRAALAAAAAAAWNPLGRFSTPGAQPAG